MPRIWPGGTKFTLNGGIRAATLPGLCHAGYEMMLTRVPPVLDSSGRPHFSTG
jgi:hypothetical protein